MEGAVFGARGRLMDPGTDEQRILLRTKADYWALSVFPGTGISIISRPFSKRFFRMIWLYGL